MRVIMTFPFYLFWLRYTFIVRSTRVVVAHDKNFIAAYFLHPFYIADVAKYDKRTFFTYFLVDTFYLFFIADVVMSKMLHFVIRKVHMNFRKWNGLGNDFIIIPPGEGGNADFSHLAPAWCDRHFGIGADGIVTLDELGGNVFKMRIFNSDGSEAGMCGNATRCAALLLKQLYGIDEFELHTKSTVVRPKVVSDGKVKVDMVLHISCDH